MKYFVGYVNVNFLGVQSFGKDACISELFLTHDISRLSFLIL
jgi:hypothetical protein